MKGHKGDGSPQVTSTQTLCGMVQSRDSVFRSDYIHAFSHLTLELTVYVLLIDVFCFILTVISIFFSSEHSEVFKLPGKKIHIPRGPGL